MEDKELINSKVKLDLEFTSPCSIPTQTNYAEFSVNVKERGKTLSKCKTESKNSLLVFPLFGQILKDKGNWSCGER